MGEHPETDLTAPSPQKRIGPLCSYVDLKSCGLFIFLLFDFSAFVFLDKTKFVLVDMYRNAAAPERHIYYTILCSV